MAPPCISRNVAVLSTTIALVGLLSAASAPATSQTDGKLTNPRHVLIIRHAEKTDDPADVHLAKRGEERARALPQLFVASADRPEPFPTPDFLFATRATDRSNRPVETVTPLALKLK